MDRYDFANVVDSIFKESGSLHDMVARYVQMKKDLDNLFQQNIALKGGEEKEQTAKKHFTPEEVRKMSQNEVKENYTAIIKSMKKWS